MVKYLIRLDDACPTMDLDKWQKVLDILDRFSIKPIIAVVPNNQDNKLKKCPEVDNFWSIVDTWQKKGYHIALHGYSHVYQTNDAGILCINKRSEFAGVPYDIQLKKIKNGWQVFKEKKIEAKIWVAPAHSFDENTLQILYSETDIRIVSDGLSIFPYKEKGFMWIPSQLSKFKKRYFGVWTICLHPNEMKGSAIEKLERDIEGNLALFSSDILELDNEYQNRHQRSMDRIFFRLYHLKRRIASLL